MSTITANQSPTSTLTRPLWRVAGGLALAHVVLMLVGVLTSGTPTIHEGQEGIEHSYVEGSLTRIFTGGYVETLAFVLLVPVLVFLARAFGRRTEAGAWASQTAAFAGLVYVAVVVAGGFAAGAAASWGAQHGLSLEQSLAINNIRNFAYYLSLAFLGAHAVGLGLAARADRLMPRWVGWGGLAIGTALLMAVPAATVGLADGVTVVWLVWWTGLAVLMLRHPRELAVR
jgi:hypothetical protein